MTTDTKTTPTQITMTYRNYRGEISQRTILPMGIWFGTTEWHPEPGWLLSGIDLEKEERRDFALADCQFADLSAPSDAVARLGDSLSFPEGWRDRCGGMDMKQQGIWSDGFRTCREQALAAMEADHD